MVYPIEGGRYALIFSRSAARASCRTYRTPDYLPMRAGLQVDFAHEDLDAVEAAPQLNLNG